MAITEKIQQYVQKLPAAFQAEVLDFVEYLFAKAERQEAREWSDLSLAFAMRGMEDDASPLYTTADLKVIFG
jgi:ribonucleotide reductase beta subunit family protein with ferritin-like domain